MVFSFLNNNTETAASLRRKAEELLARSKDLSTAGKSATLSGENRLNRVGFDGDFRQFRDYRAGDRLRDVDWKRSGRSDDVLIRERDKNRQRVIDIHIQNNADMRYGRKYVTAALFALTFALWAKRRHDPVYFENRLFKADDLASAILESSYTGSPHPRRNAVTILLGDFISPLHELENTFSALPTGDIILLQILDMLELDLPFHGAHIFESTAIKAVVEDADAVRKNYQSGLRVQLDDIKSYCKKRHWYYDLVRTDQDFTKSFSAALAAMGHVR